MTTPLLKLYRTFEEILDSVWEEYGSGKVYGIPEKRLWSKNSAPTVEDIKFWEQIYHEPGNVGVYAAHDPHIELYMIVYYPILDSKFNGIQLFYGDTAIEQLFKVTDSLEIVIEQELTPA